MEGGATEKNWEQTYVSLEAFVDTKKDIGENKRKKVILKSINKK